MSGKEEALKRIETNNNIGNSIETGWYTQKEITHMYGGTGYSKKLYQHLVFLERIGFIEKRRKDGDSRTYEYCFENYRDEFKKWFPDKEITEKFLPEPLPDYEDYDGHMKRFKRSLASGWRSVDFLKDYAPHTLNVYNYLIKMMEDKKCFRCIRWNQSFYEYTTMGLSIAYKLQEDLEMMGNGLLDKQKTNEYLYLLKGWHNANTISRYVTPFYVKYEQSLLDELKVLSFIKLIERRYNEEVKQEEFNFEKFSEKFYEVFPGTRFENVEKLLNELQNKEVNMGNQEPKYDDSVNGTFKRILDGLRFMDERVSSINKKVVEVNTSLLQRVTELEEEVFRLKESKKKDLTIDQKLLEETNIFLEKIGV